MIQFRLAPKCDVPKSRRKARPLDWMGDVPCIICGKPMADEERTRDHLVPAAFLSPGGKQFGVGIVFPAHRACNIKRGHSAPTQEMIERAGEILAGLGPDVVARALETIETAMDDHRTFLATLEDLRAEVGRRLAAEREW